MATRPSPSLRPCCPRCGGSVLRTPRRWIDTLVNLFRPRPAYRWRCRSFGCIWEGNLRQRTDRKRRGRHSHVQHHQPNKETP